MRILCLQGPNLNLLGTREPAIYGSETLGDVQARLEGVATELGVTLEHHQTNHEGELIDLVQMAPGRCAGCVINPGAYGHTSIALRDAFASVALPFVEVHVSNIYAREPYRRHSMLAEVAVGSVVGLGAAGYEMALRGLVGRLRAT